MPTARAQVVLGALEGEIVPWRDDIEYGQCLLGDFWTDAVTSDDGERKGLRHSSIIVWRSERLDSEVGRFVAQMGRAPFEDFRWHVGSP
jgi:hypothetical protein